MELKDFINSQITKLEAERYNAMVIDWRLEGELNAYKHILDIFNESLGEITKKLTDENIEAKGREVMKCYLPSRVDCDGTELYSEDIALSMFVSGAQWGLTKTNESCSKD